MAIELNDNETQFLANQMKLGRVALFCGAGFSLGATNQLNSPPPLGNALAKDLAEIAGFAYSNETLPLVYDAARNVIGDAQMRDRLRERYDVAATADWYSDITNFVWYRIYTTNIDNLIDKIYRTSSVQRLRRIVCPAADIERDPHFLELQCVHLHGHVDDLDRGLTFTLEDFANQTATGNAWYQTLVDDLYNHPIVFIGTLLQESPFYHYVMLREAKSQLVYGLKESRPKSYIVSPRISPIHAATLQRQNIVPINATAEEFLAWLRQTVPADESSLNAVRIRAFPHAYLPELGGARDSIVSYFDPIDVDQLPSTPRGLPNSFYLGAEPTWQDIREGRDGDRVATEKLLDDIDHHDNKLQVVVIQGHAGSGKTTVLKRAAAELARQGKHVFFARSEQLVSLDGIIALAESEKMQKSRLFAFIDNASQHVGAIIRPGKRLLSANNITLVLAENTNRYARDGHALEPIVTHEIKLAELTREEVISILDRLKRFNFLGALANKSEDAQIDEFMNPLKSSRQLLVAMREATKGAGFDQILEEEFRELPHDAKLAYTICCMAVAQGASGVYRKVLTPSLGTTTFAKSKIIDELLKGVLVAGNDSGTLLRPRHPLIAVHVVKHSASMPLKVEAVTSFLKELAPSVTPDQIRKRTPAFLAYRGLINSNALYGLFEGDRQAILGLYEELEPYYKEHFLFWLHYAMAYRDQGELDVAENYLLQAEARCAAVGADPYQIRHQMSILHLIQAANVIPATSAKEKADRAMDVMLELIAQRGDTDPQAYGGYLEYALRWYVHADDLVSQNEWEALRQKAREAKAKHWREGIMAESAEKVEKAYLLRAVSSLPSADEGPPDQAPA
jgi:hypothetical protein